MTFALNHLEINLLIDAIAEYRFNKLGASHDIQIYKLLRNQLMNNLGFINDKD